MNDERAGKNGGILWKRWRKYAAEAMRMRLRHIGGAGFCCKKADFAGMKKMQRFCFPIGRVTRRQMKYL